MTAAPKKKQSEGVLAEDVISWLEAKGWDVYQEVRPNPYGSWAIDIVAVQNGVVWAIECKTALSIKVIAQAMRDIRVASNVSIAVPGRKAYGSVYSQRPTDDRKLALQILRERDIGLIEVFINTIRETLPPSDILHPEALSKVLRPEHKTHAKAGSAKGGQWTPFKATSEAITNYVSNHPEGVTITELERAIKHHYASAQSFRQSIPGLLDKGVIKDTYLSCGKAYPKSYNLPEIENTK